MGEIMNSPKGIKSGVPERVNISYPTCGTCHNLPQITGNQSYVTVSEQTIQHMWHRGVKFVNNVYNNICSGYKHFTLIDEKTSIPLSVRGAYIATTAPYLNIWCLQYFPLIQRRQWNHHTYKILVHIYVQ